MQIYTLEFNHHLRMNPIFAGRTMVLALLVVATSIGGAHGQARSLMDIYGQSADQPSSRLGSQASDDARKQSEQRVASALYAPLEGPVDPESYLVGPNDQFTVTVGGLQPIVTPILVSADGSLVIPGIGSVMAGGKTLAAVEKDTRNLLGGSFQNVQVDIALTRPREFWVHVTGAVPQPGRYLAQPVGRLEDVLRQAFLLAEQSDADLDPTFRPALRNVKIRHQDGTSETFDLVKYYRTGDVSSNPYLRDGDAITVPSYDRIRSSVFISGDVPFPGNYDYRPGDTILDLLDIGGGNLELNSEREIRLTHPVGQDSVVTKVYTLASLVDGSASAPELHPLDQINVPKPPTTGGVAAADGWLRYPGQYPIEAGTTTLTDLISMAGGFRPDALVRGAYVERNSAFGEKVEYLDPTMPIPNQFEIITDTSAALWQMRLGDLDFFSRQFLARWMKMDRRVSVDVLAATQPNAPPVYLQDGDRLFVPRDQQSVYVIGEVSRPGRVPISKDTGSEGYVAAAGGRGPRATGTYVIRAGTGALQPASVPVYSGDIIFVDRAGGEISSFESERLRIMDESQKTSSRQLWLQAMTAGAAVVTTTILVIRELGN